MTTRQRVRRTRAALVVATVLSAVMWAGMTGLAFLATVGGFDAWVGLSRELRSLAVPAGLIVAGAVALIVMVRNRGIWSERHVALWVERQQPTLAYRLVTVLDPAVSIAPALETQVRNVRWTKPALQSMARGAGIPLVGIVPALVIVALLPSGALERVTTPRVGDILIGPNALPVPDAIAPIVVSITPPAYTRLEPRILEEPRTVSAVQGSRIIVGGVGDAETIRALMGDVQLTASRTERGWQVDFTMEGEPVTLVLSRGAIQRVLGLEPIADSLPLVTLVVPQRDTVVREAVGQLQFEAEVRDDFRVRATWIEYIISAGQGESYSFRSGVLGRQAVGQPTGTLSHLLSLESLGLGPGDLVHLRAVAEDNNDVSGPGRGVSETRTLRVARSREYDSISVEVLPPVPADSSLLSQRLLIMLAEALIDERTALAPDTFMRESRRLGQDQTALRRQVAEVIFVRLTGEEGEHAHDAAEFQDLAQMSPQEVLAAAEAATDDGAGDAIDFHGDESPVVAINRPLLEAYNAMWDAASELNLGDPDAALPYMYVALEAIQRARAAERIYLRGSPPRVVIDLDQVRLVGELDDVRPGDRSNGTAVALGGHGDRLMAIVEVLATGDARAADSLLVLRIEVLADNQALAAALADVLQALDEGRDLTTALIRARRTIMDPSVQGALGAWGWVP